MVAMVAVLDTKPEASPVNARPMPGPAMRSAIWAAPCIAMMTSTSPHMRRGLAPSSQALALSGSSGHTMRAAPARIRASRSSPLLSVTRTKWCRGPRRLSNEATTTAAPAEMAGLSIAFTPSRKARNRASSVVTPGSSERSRQCEIRLRASTSAAAASTRLADRVCASPPVNDTRAKLRTPTKARVGPLPLLRSRSTPISRPQPSATPSPVRVEVEKVMP